ncbi:MAG: hypothetical protein WAZ08_00300, partial [Bifidobacterium adolescentis]
GFGVAPFERTVSGRVERLKFVIAIELLCLSGMDELCYIPWYVKRFFFLACGAFCKAGNERYIASGMRPSESHQCIRKAGILEKGETRIPARRCEEVLLHKQTAYGRVVPAFARLSARSGGTYEQSTGLFT